MHVTPVDRYVAANVARLRAERGWSLTDTARKLGKIGHSLVSTSVHRIEHGRRRVGVGDLVALALVFDVSPIALLLPPTVRETAELTKGRTADWLDAWDWMRVRRPLGAAKDDALARVEFEARCLPRELRTPVVVIADDEDERDARFAEAYQRKAELS
jgi:transcriptional regulator with XRE-family HTH domain